MKKKIAIFYSGAKIWGGVETYLDNLIRDTKDDDLEFYLFSMGKWELTEKLSGILGDRIVVFSPKRVNIPLLLRGLPKTLRSKKIDVLVSQGVVANAYARFASLLSRIPHVCIVHSDINDEYKNPLNRLFYIFSDWLLRNATKRYIAVSEFISERLVQRGVRRDKIKVIYNGIKVRKQKTENRKQKNLHNKFNKIIIGSLGRLNYEKGYDLLIEAAKTLPKNMEIRICGEGRERDRLTELIEKYNLAEKVKLLGFCNKVEEFCSTLDLYVQPSRSEGFGLTVLEALEQEVPVLVSDKGALPELVFHNKTFYFKDLSPEAISEKIKYATANMDNLKEETLELKKKVEKEFGYDRWLKEVAEELKNI